MTNAGIIGTTFSAAYEGSVSGVTNGKENKFGKFSSKVVLPGYPFKEKHIDLNEYRQSQKALPANGTLDIKAIDFFTNN